VTKGKKMTQKGLPGQGEKRGKRQERGKRVRACGATARPKREGRRGNLNHHGVFVGKQNAGNAAQVVDDRTEKGKEKKRVKRGAGGASSGSDGEGGDLVGEGREQKKKQRGRKREEIHGRTSRKRRRKSHSVEANRRMTETGHLWQRSRSRRRGKSGINGRRKDQTPLLMDLKKNEQSQTWKKGGRNLTQKKTQMVQWARKKKTRGIPGQSKNQGKTTEKEERR